MAGGGGEGSRRPEVKDHNCVWVGGGGGREEGSRRLEVKDYNCVWVGGVGGRGEESSRRLEVKDHKSSAALFTSIPPPPPPSWQHPAPFSLPIKLIPLHVAKARGSCRPWRVVGEVSTMPQQQQQQQQQLPSRIADEPLAAGGNVARPLWADGQWLATPPLSPCVHTDVVHAWPGLVLLSFNPLTATQHPVVCYPTPFSATQRPVVCYPTRFSATQHPVVCYPTPFSATQHPVVCYPTSFSKHPFFCTTNTL